MENKLRKWWLAGLLSLVEPGLGQVYNGQFRKGVLLFLLPLVLLPCYVLCLNSRHLFAYLAAYLLLALFYYLFVVGDAIVQARRQGGAYRLKNYNRLSVYVAVVVVATLVSTGMNLALKYNFVQAFRIPAASMEPTLLVGDRILVDRSVYAREPKRGAVIVFAYPEDPRKDFVKRVVAVGGDTVAVRDKQLYVNGRPLLEPYIEHRESELFPATVNPRDNFGPVTIPTGACFVLGDNRDRSYDSRFWGVVGKERIKGTVKNIYWSWDRERNAVRWARIGTMIL